MDRTTRGERAIEITWAEALPMDESRRLADALAKAQLGVPAEVLRRELGYADVEINVSETNPKEIHA